MRAGKGLPFIMTILVMQVELSSAMEVIGVVVGSSGWCVLSVGQNSSKKLNFSSGVLKDHDFARNRLI